MYDIVRAGYGEKFGKDFDSSARNTDANIADKRRARKEKKEDDIVDAELATNPDGTVARGNEMEDSSMNPEEFTLKTKGGKPIKGIMENNPDTEILSIVRRGDQYFAKTRTTSEVTSTEKESGGGMPKNFSIGSTASGNSSRTKSTETVNEQVALSETELNSLARRFNLRNATELEAYLTDRMQSAGAKKEKEKISW